MELIERVRARPAVADASGAAGRGTGAARGRGRARVAERTVLLVASFGALLAFLDATIVNVAFPSIRESFAAADIGSISWVRQASQRHRL